MNCPQTHYLCSRPISNVHCPSSTPLSPKPSGWQRISSLALLTLLSAQSAYGQRVQEPPIGEVSIEPPKGFSLTEPTAVVSGDNIGVFWTNSSSNQEMSEIWGTTFFTGLLSPSLNSFRVQEHPSDEGQVAKSLFVQHLMMSDTAFGNKSFQIESKVCVEDC